MKDFPNQYMQRLIITLIKDLAIPHTFVHIPQLGIDVAIINSLNIEGLEDMTQDEFDNFVMPALLEQGYDKVTFRRHNNNNMVIIRVERSHSDA